MREVTAGSGVGEVEEEEEVEGVEEVEEVDERVEEMEEMEEVEERVGEELSSCQVHKKLPLYSGVYSSGWRLVTSSCAISSVYGDRFIPTDSSFIPVLFSLSLSLSVLVTQGS